MPRIAPLPRREWPAEMHEAIAALRPAVSRHPAPIREDRPLAPGTLETFAHHPDLARAFFTFNGHVLFNTTLTSRQRQILVLRVATLRKSAYLWAQHVFQARDAGVTDEEMSRIAFGPDAPFFAPLESALLRAADELVDDGAIGDATWNALESELDAEQLLDVIFTIGCYDTMARFFRTLDLEPDPAIPEMLAMKPAPFEYHTPASVDEAVALLAELGEGAKVIAGGQSLVPMLALRLAVFDHLVDLRRLHDLRGIERRNGSLWIGAVTTQATIESSPDVAAAVPLLARATPLIGHFQIRNRGTIGGSLAHADPAAEYPAVALTLDAELEAQSPRGRRRIAAAEFFTGTWSTALADDEVLTGVTFPVWQGRCGFAVEELARRHGDFAIAGATVAVELDDADRITRCAIGLLGLGSLPVRAAAAAAEVTGAAVGVVDAGEVGRVAVSTLESVPTDLHTPAAYRTRVGAVMVARAWQRAVEEARGAAAGRAELAGERSAEATRGH